MQPEQRASKSSDAFEEQEQMWAPRTVHGANGGAHRRAEVRSGDRYVTVDDVADGMVVVDVSEWPRLDREGRLYWETDPFEVVVPFEEFQSVVDAARAEAGITAPDRPIRVGDAFLVRGIPSDGPSLVEASLVLDISAAARDAAKMALYGAAASTLNRHEARRLQVTGGYEQAVPEAGYFDVRQIKSGGPDTRETAS